MLYITKAFDYYPLRTCNEWTDQNNFTGQYHRNDYLKEISKSIIDELRKPHACIRITGPSGTGKSRLIHQTICEDKTMSNVAVFLDGQGHSESIISVIDYLTASNMNAVLIIDNCSTSMHRQLHYRTTNSNLCLLSISHEPEQFNNPTMPFILDPSKMKEIVIKILSENPKLQSNPNSSCLIERLANYAEGFPLMAKLILLTQKTLSVDDLSTYTKFRDVLITLDSESYRKIANALSLFTIVGGSADALRQHLEEVRNLFCPDVQENDMNDAIGALKKNYMLREEGDTIRIVPPPLATALASQQICALKRSAPKDLQAKFERLSKIGLLEKFTNRLAELEISPELEDIVKVLNIPFQDADYLICGQAGALIFRQLVTLAPAEALSIVEKSLRRRTPAQLKGDIAPRRNLVVGLEKLAGSREFFPKVSSLLLRLAAGENETWANNATGILHQLFHLYCSGTSCPLNERLPILEKHLKSNDECIRSAAIETFSGVFQMWDFVKEVSTSLGDIKIDKNDWEPESENEILQYWEQAFLLLKDFIINNKSNAQLALKH